MNKSGVILHCGTASANVSYFRRIAEFAGVDLVEASWKDWRTEELPSLDCVVASADVLARSVAERGESDELFLDALSNCPHIFLYGFAENAEHNRLLKLLTAGAVEHAAPLQSDSDCRYYVKPESVESSGPLAGFHFDGADPAHEVTFHRNRDSAVAVEEMISVDDSPTYLVVRRGRNSIYLSGQSEWVNLDGVVQELGSVLSTFGRLIPALLFLRRVFPETYWRNFHSRACLIIDDPPLQRRYGFLNLAKLAEILKQERSTVSLAFIPWNARRTASPSAALLQTHPRQLSLSVHGCDHTRGEFGSGDLNSLKTKLAVAIDRMSHQERVAKVSFDRVMVFPQGIFSSVAMKALRESKFLAAVNTSPYAVDGANLVLRDLLSPALMNYSGFPLFLRRYPNDIRATAFDLFLGKPALFVEHHGYFREGYDELVQLIRDVNRLAPDMLWMPLENICRETCLQRKGRSGSNEVRFYTDRLGFQHTGASTVLFSFRREANPLVSNVLVNGLSTPYDVRGRELAIDKVLEPGESISILIEKVASVPPAASVGTRFWARLRIATRRYASEIRDNYVQPALYMCGGLRRE